MRKVWVHRMILCDIFRLIPGKTGFEIQKPPFCFVRVVDLSDHAVCQTETAFLVMNSAGVYLNLHAEIRAALSHRAAQRFKGQLSVLLAIAGDDELTTTPH